MKKFTIAIIVLLILGVIAFGVGLVGHLMGAADGEGGIPLWLGPVVGLIVMILFIIINMSNAKGKVETTKATYVKGGKVNEKIHTDRYIRTDVSKRYDPVQKNNNQNNKK